MAASETNRPDFSVERIKPLLNYASSLWETMASVENFHLETLP
jgi:hypothetical protein